MRRGLLAWSVIAATFVTGCASLSQTPFESHLSSEAPQVRSCADWFQALDAAVEIQGVRDAGTARIAGFPYLRVDRHHAALREQAAMSGPVFDALADRLLQLDFDARRHEIANLPEAARTALARSTGEPEITRIASRTRDCSRLLREIDLAKPDRRELLLSRLHVPDDYVTGYRLAGLYVLTRHLFAAGVRRHQAEVRQAYARPLDRAEGTLVRYSPPSRPKLAQSRIAMMIRPEPDDVLQIPRPSDEDLDLLFDKYAPTYEIDTAGDDDRPGVLRWRRGELPEVDAAETAVYRQIAYTRYRGRTLLQLVYTLWFPERVPGAERPPADRPSSGADLLSGKLDGVVWRVTLAPDGSPLVYDSMHPCGCYHYFFPTAAARPLPPPDNLPSDEALEWVFVPQSLPALTPDDRLVLRIASGTHFIERVYRDSSDSLARYSWRDYGELRSLNRFGPGFRSIFGPDGFVAGTDRAESWLFWPMGIARAGTMRQWGRHPTAFLGRRHFDDADLFERRFEFQFR